jgi:hypothetical protein
MTSEYIYVFSGDRGTFPGGVFNSFALAEEWILRHRLSGLLTEYPVNVGVFDWAVSTGRIRRPQGAGFTADTIAGFSSYLEHWHYENGLPASQQAE